MLALTIGDVWQNHKPVKDLLFGKGIVKGKEASRMVPVNADGRAAIGALIAWHYQIYDELLPKRPLFCSRKGGGMVAMTRGQAHKILSKAFVDAGLNGKLATHSLRKSFAQRVYDGTGDIYIVQELLGHKSIETTKKYLGVSYAKMQEAVENIEMSKRNTIGKTYHSQRNGSGGFAAQCSLNASSDDALLLEAIRRGLIGPEAIQRPERKTAVGESKIVSIDQGRR